jgi:threonine/homoserine/homoserine lactone efflux protein
MDMQTLLGFSAVAGIAILSPGPAVLLALRNGATLGLRAVIWSSLGNISGLFCLSAAAMLGLGLLLMSSAMLFAAVKILGALYLFYVGIRHLFGRSSAFKGAAEQPHYSARPGPLALYREAFLMAAFNPKPILFFTALFPQFIDAGAPLLAQFFVLTGIFMLLSFATLIAYAMVAARARNLLLQAAFAKWLNRAIGAVFISFGAALLALRRPAA